MTQKPKNNPVLQELPEPRTGFSAVPLWIVLVMGCLFFWGEMFLDEHAGGFQETVYEPYHSFQEVTAALPMDDKGAFIAKGKKVFDSTCSLCHQPNGMGKEGTAPPLAGSDWVNNKGPNRIARIVLDGLNGPITVSGKDYSLAMVAWKSSFNDEQIAAVLSYIRSQWGNKGSVIKPEQIKAIRAATASHDANWTATELLAVPDTEK